MSINPGPRRSLQVCALIAALALLTSLFLARNIDFRVYWYGAQAFLDRSRPLYGPASGLGFPLHYRYAPVTYLLLAPLAWLPLYWSGVIWMLGAWAGAAATVVLAVRVARLHLTRRAAAAACAYLLAYVVLAVRAGNVQPYVIAMIFSALLLSESRPAWSAVLLALAVTFKIWPLFFLPWFLRSGRRAALAWLFPVLALIWVLPLTVWSPHVYLDLLRQWYHSEFQSATANSELWYYPGQSFRGILLRYLSTPEPWLKGFPDVHVFSLPAATVVRAWTASAAVIYAAACVALLRSLPEKRWIWDGMAFALFTLLQPFCAKSSMVSMAPAALIAASLYSRRAASDPRDRSAALLFLSACVLSLLAATAQYRPLLNLLLALGIDFYAGILLLGALLLWSREPAQV